MDEGYSKLMIEDHKFRTKPMVFCSWLGQMNGQIGRNFSKPRATQICREGQCDFGEAYKSDMQKQVL